jgi:hypothetical protein
VLDDGESLLITEDGWVKPRAEKETDLYFFAYSYQYRRCLKDFFHLAGRTPVLPRWGLALVEPLPSLYRRGIPRLSEAFEAEGCRCRWRWWIWTGTWWTSIPIWKRLDGLTWNRRFSRSGGFFAVCTNGGCT